MATTGCPPHCIAEHHRGDTDHVWAPTAVAVLAPAAGTEPVVLLGPGQDTGGLWLELDVNGGFARVRISDLDAALAAVHAQLAAAR